MMINYELKDEYFISEEYHNWLCQLAFGKEQMKQIRYSRLMRKLDDTSFWYTILRDENREADGIDLRYKFGRYHKLSNSAVAYCLDFRPCSVLEMMVALASRCENEIMWEPDLGDRTSVWFWEMVESLGLEGMDDRNYNEDYVDGVLARFLRREYEPNGEGGLFTVHYPPYDLTNVEIWYQMHRHLNEVNRIA